MIEQIYQILIGIISKERETSFMNTENSKTNESHRFKLDIAYKLNLKNLKKKTCL